MRWIFRIVFFAFFCSIGVLFGQPPKSIASNYKLVWQEDFDIGVLDTTKWYYRGEGSLREFGIPIRENVYLDGNGNLILKITKTDSIYYVGQIGTTMENLFKYGCFECRLKVNRSKGPTTAFWIKGPAYRRFPGDPGRAGTEVDILEYRRKYKTDQLVNKVHWINKEGNHTQNTKKHTFKAVENGYHVYGLEWTPEYYCFYVDGKRTWKTRKAIAHVPQQLILSVELTGWSGDHTQAVYPDSAMYDYVRVWQKNDDLGDNSIELLLHRIP